MTSQGCLINRCNIDYVGYSRLEHFETHHLGSARLVDMKTLVIQSPKVSSPASRAKFLPDTILPFFLVVRVHEEVLFELMHLNVQLAMQHGVYS